MKKTDPKSPSAALTKRSLQKFRVEPTKHENATGVWMAMPVCQSELKLGTPVYDFELYVLCRLCPWWEWDQSRKGKEERGEEKKLLFVKTKERSVGAVNLDLSRSFPFPLFRGTRIAIQRVSRLARSLSHPRCTFLVWPRKRAKRPIKRSSFSTLLYSPLLSSHHSASTVV